MLEHETRARGLRIDLPIELEGTAVRLEPLRREHAGELASVGGDEEIWRYLMYPLPADQAGYLRYVESARALAQTGSIIPFAIVDRASGRAIGSTRYMDIAPADLMLEIGGTWLGRAYWRTRVNTECKYLLLRHAFERMGAVRVQLKTDQRNERSQAAIARLGAVREGVLRRHRRTPEGYQRSSVMFSILDDEWPAVKARLEDALARS